ncbi:ABC transporter permease [Microlunatus soli]|uniref:Osmoprotectant transport system permease protein n=1 Tax=Microlunatus soli TaxID=630515 RepID=A0A1H1VHQ5_9ACTN|nr:ABC transporter permease subunit [Microlunatus soli]SDS83891.1 osmoprotectant transport system permease protein [Microlunatus soli]
MNVFGYLLDGANWGGPDGLGLHLGEHLLYSVIAVAIAAVIGIPAGQLIGHTRRGSFLLVGLANSFRAIPTFGLLILVVLLTQTSWIPVVCVLGVLALPPLLTGTATGIMQADQQAVHAASALGMSGGQVLTRVEMPLAMPLIISGLRSATLQVIATATVAAYVPQVGGLGRTILDGIPARDYGQVLAGALLVALLAIVIDVLLALAGRATSRHLRLKAPKTTALTAAPTPDPANADADASNAAA